MAETGTDLLKAKALLEKDELVAIPTETVYGLAGNALSEKALLSIFETKNRPQFDPLIVHVASIDQARELVTDFSPAAEKLAKEFWPGPLTLLLKKKKIIPDLATSGLDTVGIRCPDHPLTLSLLRTLSFPLAAPSANPFGYVSPTQASHVNDQLGNQIEYILDGDASRVGIESTIVGFVDDNPVIYRLGGLSIEKIESIVGKADIQINSSSNPKAPGQLKSHYAPGKRVRLGNLAHLLNESHESRIGVIAFQHTVHGIDSSLQIVLSPTGNVAEAARNLFRALREMDKKPVDLILAEQVPEAGLGRAINDRLQRAAADKI